VADPCPIYLAAPIAAPTLAEQIANCDRAAKVAAFLRSRGHEVVCVHEQAALELMASGGETAAMRAEALVRCLAMVRATVEAGGVVAVLMRDDCTLSSGCALEIEQARQTWEALDPATRRGKGYTFPRMTWQGWLDTPGFFG
jgi:hypothetical protein